MRGEWLRLDWSLSKYQVRADGNSNSKDFAVYPTQSPW